MALLNHSQVNDLFPNSEESHAFSSTTDARIITCPHLRENDYSFLVSSLNLRPSSAPSALLRFSWYILVQ